MPLAALQQLRLEALHLPCEYHHVDALAGLDFHGHAQVRPPTAFLCSESLQKLAARCKEHSWDDAFVPKSDGRSGPSISCKDARQQCLESSESSHPTHDKQRAVALEQHDQATGKHKRKLLPHDRAHRSPRTEPLTEPKSKESTSEDTSGLEAPVPAWIVELRKTGHKIKKADDETEWYVKDTQNGKVTISTKDGQRVEEHVSPSEFDEDGTKKLNEELEVAERDRAMEKVLPHEKHQKSSSEVGDTQSFGGAQIPRKEAFAKDEAEEIKKLMEENAALKEDVQSQKLRKKEAEARSSEADVRPKREDHASREPEKDFVRRVKEAAEVAAAVETKRHAAAMERIDKKVASFEHDLDHMLGQDIQQAPRDGTATMLVQAPGAEPVLRAIGTSENSAGVLLPVACLTSAVMQGRLFSKSTAASSARQQRSFQKVANFL